MTANLKSANTTHTPERNSPEEIEAWLDGIEGDSTVEVFDGSAPNSALRKVAASRNQVSAAESELASAVAAAREGGHSWAAIGAVLGGVSKQAAQQRFG